MPPKTIYKPSKGVKAAPVGQRDKSQRTRTKKEIYQAALPSKKLLKREKRQSQWTVKEKPILIRKIKEQGSSDASLLLDPEIRKTEDQIKDLITFHKKGNRLKEVPRVNPKSHSDTVWVPKEISNPIESWITLAEAHKIPFGSGLMDCSHILGDSLAVIINEEKHPKPEDCHGVDYAEIYRYINSLMNGDLPKQPNEETARKIMEMMNELKDTVLSATSNENFKQEQVLLERYTMRDINTLSGPFLDKFTHQAIKNLCAMPKMNPLNLPPALFSKKFLSKESKSTESSAQK